MAAFQYRAIDKSGREVQGVENADSPRQAREKLRGRGLIPSQIKVISGSDAKTAFGGANSDKSAQKTVKISGNDLSIFTRQLATLLSSGLTVESALQSIANQSGRNKMAVLASGVRAKVLEGRALGDAMATFPKSFNELYWSTVKAGESSGKLSEVMLHLADYLENRIGLQRRLSTQLIYPAILLIVSILVVVLMVTLVVPQLRDVFTQAEAELPTATRVLLGISDFFVAYWPLMLLSIIGLGAAIYFYYKTDAGRQFIDERLLKAPFFGPMILRADTARMSRTLAIMVGSGVPLMTGLKAAASVVGNSVLKKEIQFASKEVEQGHSLSNAINRRERFAPFLIQMISNGEATGLLAEMLQKAAVVTENEHESRVKAFVALFEPIMVVIMALMVFGIIMAVLLPIINMNDLVL